MRRYAILNLVLLACSAPWLFVGTQGGRLVAGFPLWAAYCLAVAVFYALFVALSLGRLWDREFDAAQDGDD
jgi:hypothetical protein